MQASAVVVAFDVGEQRGNHLTDPSGLNAVGGYAAYIAPSAETTTEPCALSLSCAHGTEVVPASCPYAVHDHHAPIAMSASAGQANYSVAA